MLARLTLRQEDVLTQFSLDKNFMFFMQCGRGSIMPSMLIKAKEWNSRKQNGDASPPLRITMLTYCFQERAHRAKQFQLETKDDALVMNLQSKGILTEDNKWAYANKTPPLTSEELRTLLERITRLGQQPSVVYKFSALRPVNQENLPQDAAVTTPWRLNLSLRIPEASELHQLLSITQLALLRVRLANLQRSPLANAISQRLNR